MRESKSKTGLPQSLYAEFSTARRRLRLWKTLYSLFLTETTIRASAADQGVRPTTIATLKSSGTILFAGRAYGPAEALALRTQNRSLHQWLLRSAPPGARPAVGTGAFAGRRVDPG